MTDTKKVRTERPPLTLTPDRRIPDTLQSELRRMRRSPEGFKVSKLVKCGLGCGKLQAYALTHEDSENAGTWCPQHGWLFFDSVKLLPTERLTTSEVEDRKLTEARKRGPRVVSGGAQ